MQICVMNWKTFLNLFKSNYSIFYYDGINWRFKNTNIKIILHFNNSLIEDERITFLNEKEIARFGFLQDRI